MIAVRRHLIAAALCATTSHAGEVTYPDSRGGEIHFPLGDASFADAVTAFAPGTPDGGAASARPDAALGPPDYDRAPEGYVTLGCGGVLTLSFADNALTDTAGPDLYVFEIGPDVEPTGLSISQDGTAWTRVGLIQGGKAEVDIADFVTGGASFRFVRLTDLKTACGAFAGADIDAVGAIGSATRIAIDSAVLFETGRHDLKPSAAAELDKAVRTIAAAKALRVVVEGHTDDVGSAADNMALSERRAEAVAAYLAKSGKVPPGIVETQAYGETQPVAPNDTDEGRSRNRRVEIVVHAVPAAVAEGTPPRRVIVGVWGSTQGLVELGQFGAGVEGRYGGTGRIEGRFLAEALFEGYWIEDRSDRECATVRGGSRYWGRLSLKFADASRDAFAGTWSYCDEPPDRTGWDGTRLL